YLDAASGAGGFDHVLTGGAAAGVHQNLDEISLCHTPSLFPIRIELMRYQRVAQPPPEAHSVEQLKEAAASCQACDLWREATQTVFGEGAEHARMMLVGEQPGDQEDLQGKPFVGPAGRLLERALDEAEIDRRRVYVTNAVKHFRWTRRGKRRLHEKPNAGQVRACRPWLEAEIEVVRPGMLVLLGATASQSVMGPAFRVSQQRGEVLRSPFGIPVVATVHPSSILRAPDAASLAQHRAAGMPVVRGVGERLPFVSDSFDLIVSIWVLEHLEDPLATFIEVRRVLRPGGHFIFLTPNLRNPLMLMNRIGRALPALQRRLVPRMYGRDEADTFPVRYRANTEREIRDHARGSDLRVEELRVIPDPTYLAMN